MRRVTALAACAALFALSSRAVAADEWTAPPTPEHHPTPAFSMALGGTYVRYEEDVSPGKSTESGVVPGGRFAAALALPQLVVLRATFALGYGKTRYVGTNQIGTPLEGDHDNLIAEPEADVGYRVANTRSLRGTLYGGLGFRFWRRDLTSLDGGYVEDYTLWQAAFGVVVDSGTAHPFNVGLDVAIVPTFAGQVHAHFSGELAAVLSDIDLPVGDAVGVRAAVPFTWRFDGWRLFATASYRFLPLALGGAVTLRDATGAPATNQNGQIYTAREPASRARLITLRVGVGL